MPIVWKVRLVLKKKYPKAKKTQEVKDGLKEAGKLRFACIIDALEFLENIHKDWPHPFCKVVRIGIGNGEFNFFTSKTWKPRFQWVGPCPQKFLKEDPKQIIADFYKEPEVKVKKTVVINPDAPAKRYYKDLKTKLMGRLGYEEG